MLRLSVHFDFSAFRAAVVRDLPNNLLEPLRKIRERMVSSFYAPKSGRPGPVRQRSARGEAPASQTKRLERSMTQPAMVSDTRAQMIIAAPYAQFLNDPGKLNRPFVEPAIRDVLPKFKPVGAI